MKVAIIIGTTRSGRQSHKLGLWALDHIKDVESVDAEIIDLGDYPMPFFEEPISPRYNPNRDPNTTVKKWLEKVSEFDAYIIVTPEYNHAIPGVLKNAIDYFDWQVKQKPFAIISHGSTGGARAISNLKVIISEVQAVPIPSSVALTMRVGEVFDDNGILKPKIASNPYGPVFALTKLIDELKWYSDALSAARAKS